MVYIDTSSLLKTLWEEPESGAVLEQIAVCFAQDMKILMSSLTRVECEVQLRARRLGGFLNKSQYTAYRLALADYVDQGPFEYQELSGDVFRTALRMIDVHASVHCRTLDRLHLAAMEELGVRRLMTNDARQAEAARAMGIEALVPGA